MKNQENIRGTLIKKSFLDLGGPPLKNDWPPRWLLSVEEGLGPKVILEDVGTVPPIPVTQFRLPEIELAKEPPQSPAIERSVSSSPEVPPELEAFLKAILEGVLARTDDPEIIQSAKNLLDICRDQFREGKPEVAWGNARYLQKQIPGYLTQRRIP